MYVHNILIYTLEANLEYNSVYCQTCLDTSPILKCVFNMTLYFSVYSNMCLCHFPIFYTKAFILLLVKTLLHLYKG